MDCKEARQYFLDLVGKGAAAVPQAGRHTEACPNCAAELESLRSTMALLDEWKAPEPSPYFDSRLRARLRSEARPETGWLDWWRKPALAFALAALMLIAGGLLRQKQLPIAASPGTAVGDLQELDKNQELYADFDLLDDLRQGETP